MEIERLIRMWKEIADQAERTSDMVCQWLESKKAELGVKAAAGDAEAIEHIKLIDHLLSTRPKKR